MRILLCTILLFLSYNSELYCQRWNYGLNLGYSLGTAPQNISSNVSSDPNKTTNEVVKGSFGKGFNASCFLIYWIRNNIGLEVAFSYLNGSQYEGSYTKDTLFKQNIKVNAKMARIIPAVRIKLRKEDKKSGLYLKLGAAVRVFGNITNETTYVDIQSNTTSISEMKYSKGLSLGIVGGAGYSYQLSPNVAMFGEFLFISQSWAPKNGDMAKYTVNDIDQMDVLSSSQKHIHFSDKYTSSNTSQSNYTPSQQLKQYHNFSSIALSLGLQFVIGKKKEK